MKIIRNHSIYNSHAYMARDALEEKAAVTETLRCSNI